MPRTSTESTLKVVRRQLNSTIKHVRLVEKRNKMHMIRKRLPLYAGTGNVEYYSMKTNARYEGQLRDQTVPLQPKQGQKRLGG